MAIASQRPHRPPGPPPPHPGQYHAARRLRLGCRRERRLLTRIGRQPGQLAVRLRPTHPTTAPPTRAGSTPRRSPRTAPPTRRSTHRPWPPPHRRTLPQPPAPLTPQDRLTLLVPPARPTEAHSRRQTAHESGGRPRAVARVRRRPALVRPGCRRIDRCPDRLTTARERSKGAELRALRGDPVATLAAPPGTKLAQRTERDEARRWASAFTP